MLNKSSFLAGTVVFAALWWLAYRAARPAIAAAAGQYVRDHALDAANLPPLGIAAVNALGAQTYENFLGAAVQSALEEKLP